MAHIDPSPSIAMGFLLSELESIGYCRWSGSAGFGEMDHPLSKRVKAGNQCLKTTSALTNFLMLLPNCALQLAEPLYLSRASTTRIFGCYHFQSTASRTALGLIAKSCFVVAAGGRQYKPIYKSCKKHKPLLSSRNRSQQGAASTCGPFTFQNLLFRLVLRSEYTDGSD